MGLRWGFVAPTVAPATTANPAAQKVSAPRSEVKGQVAMHAIESGYAVASRLAATLASSPEKVKETLHSLAEEVARKIEAYTFHE